MSEVGDCAEIRFRVQRHRDVESLRPGGFDPTRKAQLLQQCAHVLAAARPNVYSQRCNQMIS
jgi:hypothetical protein